MLNRTKKVINLLLVSFTHIFIIQQNLAKVKRFSIKKDKEILCIPCPCKVCKIIRKFYLMAYLLVEPNPPFLTPSAWSSSVIRYLLKIACPIISPFFISISWSEKL